MKHGIRGWAFIVSIVVFAAGMLIAAQMAEAADQDLSARIGSKGICVLLGADDPAGAIGLARQSDLMLYVQSPDAKRVNAFRQAADAAGLLGKRIFVDQGADAHIQLAGNLADAVVVGGGAQVADAELLRVLRPGGKAIVADREIKKPAPAGTDSWSHPYHGPDNNPLSKDQLARYPYMTQFLAEPLFSSQPEVTVAAGGRVFKAFGHMTFRAYQNPSINKLFAMNAYNGTILWQRELKPGFMIHRNTMIATSDLLYMADDESCKLYDASTGQLRDEIVAPQEQSDGPVWKWMALVDGVLYAMIGAKEVPAPVAKGTDTRIGGWPWGMWPGYDYADPKTAWGYGRAFVALDLKTKKPIWTHREDEYIDSRGVCMASGRIYCYSPGKFLACLDAKTGSPVWKTSDQALLAAIGSHGKAQDYRLGFSTSTYMKCTDRLILFAGPQRKMLVAASASDGKLLWTYPDGNFQLVLREDGIYALGNQFGKSYKFDYLTGRIMAEFRGRRACTRATGTMDSVFCRATEGTIRWEMGTNNTQHIAPMRPACHDGVVVSDGMLYWGPWICGCHLTLVGAICLGPATEADFQAPADDGGQLWQAADVARLKEFNTAANDWTGYLGNNQRSRISPARVPPQIAQRWEYKPPSTGYVTAPIAAGGLVFVGAEDGTVRAIDANSGQVRWTAYTGGSILFPPAVADGRLFVGSNDGCVYAFEAASGAALWKFRAAPAERKIPVYGELMSTWPVAGGVVVQSGVVYAAAGISHFDGTHVYALDAATGKTKWRNTTSGVVDPEVRNGISVCGPLRLEGDRLTFPGGNVYATATHDIRNGRCGNQPAGANTVRRIFLLPRKLWEPIDGDELRVAAGTVRVGPPRGARGHTIGLFNGDPAKPAWSARAAAYNGSVVAGDTLLVLGRMSDTEDGKPSPWRIDARRVRDGQELFSRALPGTPVHYGVAVDGAGRVVVSLEDGRVVCFAGEGVASAE